MKTGYVYAVSNPFMIGMIKIGFTTGLLETRLKELRSTGVPTEFVVEVAVCVVNPHKLEKKPTSEFR